MKGTIRKKLSPGFGVKKELSVGRTDPGKHSREGQERWGFSKSPF